MAEGRDGVAMLVLPEIAPNLELGADGIWSARNVSAVSYPEEGNASCLEVEDSSFWFRHRNQCIVEAVKLVPPSTPFFDVGGGNGFVAKALQDAGLEVVVVEPGTTGVQNACRRRIQHVIHATLEDAGFLSGVLPSVGLFDVVEHIREDLAFLRAVRNYLRADGTLYLTVPAGEWLWSQEDVVAGHHRRYTRRTLSRLLEEAGFRVEFLTCIFGFLPFPILVCRSLPYRLGWHRGPGAPVIDRKDHEVGKSTGRILNFLMQRELRRIRARKESFLGGSFLAVARKV